MGQAKNKSAGLAKFLAQHPRCCFCGGLRVAETGDHVPGRAIFLERKWPEGYLFPACTDCNAATSKDEMLIAVFARAFPNAETGVEQREFRAALSGPSNNWPETLVKLKPTLGQALGSPFDVLLTSQ
jgi:hypothetical protein